MGPNTHHVYSSKLREDIAHNGRNYCVGYIDSKQSLVNDKVQVIIEGCALGAKSAIYDCLDVDVHNKSTKIYSPSGKFAERAKRAEKQIENPLQIYNVWTYEDIADILRVKVSAYYIMTILKTLCGE